MSTTFPLPDRPARRHFLLWSAEHAVQLGIHHDNIDCDGRGIRQELLDMYACDHPREKAVELFEMLVDILDVAEDTREAARKADGRERDELELMVDTYLLDVDYTLGLLVPAPHVTAVAS